jgi:hypothetical protein
MPKTVGGDVRLGEAWVASAEFHRGRVLGWFKGLRPRCARSLRDP